jgi:proton-translocating NADH-quinone oxidoreductase chain M
MRNRRGLVVLPRVGAAGVSRRPDAKRASTVARRVSGRVWAWSLRRWVQFDYAATGYQFVETYAGRMPRGAQRSRGVDGISRFFVRLTTLRTPLCRLASREGIRTREKEYYALFRAREGLVIAVFVVTDRLWFYVAFEAVLVPMFLRIGGWGSRARKVRAAYFFFRYTLVGSLFRLRARVYRQYQCGTTDRTVLSQKAPERSVEVQRRLWLAFFASFAVKVPMVPVHIWLPEAHVEAPTAGSVILAGIRLKLGTYGMMRRLRPRFPAATVYFTPLVYARSVVAIVYTSRTAIRQTDRKRIIAYASVAHMNMTLVGLFSRTVQGVEGALLQMLSHGLVAGALFMAIGVLYDRYHTRRVAYYGGVAHTMPLFALVFRVFTMANIALPGTSSFVGEFLILVGIAQTNSRVTARSATGMVLGGAYSLWLYNRVVYGNLKTRYVGERVQDRTRRERYMFRPLRRGTRRLGVYPSRILDAVHASCAALVEHVRRGS